MREIIVSAASQKLMSTLHKVLLGSGMAPARLCKNASEVFALFSEIEDALLICGPLKDTPSIYLAKSVPDSWDVVLLLSSNEPFPYYVSNIIPVTLPINRSEFTGIVSDALGVQSESYGAKATAVKVRPQQEKELIEKAKLRLMKDRGLCESDAHRFLQRYSMNLGITMYEAAKRFLQL